VVAASTGTIRWLETRPKSSWWGRRARQLARVAMLGFARQPTYLTSGQRAALAQAAGVAALTPTYGGGGLDRSGC